MDSFAAADGTRIAYETRGRGPLLVCVPGGPGRAPDYLEDLGGLAATRTLLLLHPRGVGRSGRPADPAALAFPAVAADLEDLRRHLGSERLDLLAHSAGSVVARVFAGLHPGRVGALVLVTAPVWPRPADVLDGGGSDVAAVRASRAREPWYADAAAALEALRTVTDPAEAEPLVDRLTPFNYGRWDDRARAHAAPSGAQMSPAAWRGFASGPVAEAFDPGPVLDGLATRPPGRSLVVAGELDGATGVAAARDAAAQLGSAGPGGARLVVLPGCGHYPWVDDPAAFVAAVEPVLTP